MITELVRERLARADGESGPDKAGPDQDCPADCCRYAAGPARPAGASRA
jgi:hypothetical protein